MPTFYVTVAEQELLHSKYEVEALDANSALEALAHQGNLFARLDAESMNYKFLRFKQVWNPEDGQRIDITDEQNKQLLGEDFDAKA